MFARSLSNGVTEITDVMLPAFVVVDTLIMFTINRPHIVMIRLNRDTVLKDQMFKVSHKYTFLIGKKELWM